MKQITAQQFANIFDMYVAKDKNDLIFAYENKPEIDEGCLYWSNYDDNADVTQFISDADSLDWNVLIEPQKEPAEPSPVPFDENYAPEGYKAVEEKSGWVACTKCAFSGTTKCNDTTFLCLGNNRPDRTDVYFVKKENAK